MGHAGKPDDLSFGAFLCCVIADVVSPRMDVICDVACPISPSGTSCDVIDASVTAPRREAALCKATGDSVLLAAQEEPSMLLGLPVNKLLLMIVRCWA